MRFLIVLFGIYISLLSVMPCHDSVECNETRAERVTDHRNHASDEEQCPPFCTCACCGVQIAQFEPVHAIPQNREIEMPKQKPSFYAFALPNEICRSIWQPPKISKVLDLFKGNRFLTYNIHHEKIHTGGDFLAVDFRGMGAGTGTGFHTKRGTRRNRDPIDAHQPHH